MIVSACQEGERQIEAEYVICGSTLKMGFNDDEEVTNNAHRRITLRLSMFNWLVHRLLKAADELEINN